MTHSDPHGSEWLKLCKSCGLLDKTFYSLLETSQLVGCARTTVARWVKVGYLDTRRWGPRRVRVTATSIRNALHMPSPPTTDAVDLHVGKPPTTDAVDLHVGNPPTTDAVNLHVGPGSRTDAVDLHVGHSPTTDAVDLHPPPCRPPAHFSGDPPGCEANQLVGREKNSQKKISRKKFKKP